MEKRERYFLNGTIKDEYIFKLNDIIDTRNVWKLDSKILKQLTPEYDKGRQRFDARRWKLARRMFRRFQEKIVEHVLDGDRVIFPEPDNIQLYIGVDHSMDNVPNLKKPYLNLHTAGKKYGLLIKGFDHDYHIKLNPKYRKILARRLMEGWEYVDY